MPQRSKRWEDYEDETLTKLVIKHGQNWKLISNKLHTVYKLKKRTGKQCRQRYSDHLSINRRIEKWTHHETNKIFEMHSVIGTKWKEISQQFPGRSDNCVKNHFFSSIRKSITNMCKYSGVKSSINPLKKIKLSILSQILRLESQNHSTQINQTILDEEIKENIFIDDLQIPKIVAEFVHKQQSYSKTREEIHITLNKISKMNQLFQNQAKQKALLKDKVELMQEGQNDEVEDSMEKESENVFEKESERGTEFLNQSIEQNQKRIGFPQHFRLSLIHFEIDAFEDSEWYVPLEEEYAQLFS